MFPISLLGKVQGVANFLFYYVTVMRLILLASKRRAFLALELKAKLTPIGEGLIY